MIDEKIIESITKSVLNEIENKSMSSGLEVKVGVSARHVHLTGEDVETLFGKGYKLTKKSDLMGGQFASNERVTIVGTKLRAIENVRILGPVRKESQVEISATDALKLGIIAPLRDSGDIDNTAAIAVVGPKGAVYLKKGCIIAKRHIHMSDSDAQKAGLKDKAIVSVSTVSDRGVVFDNVLIRVDKSFTLEMHIDTDEANAAGLKTGDFVKIVQ